MLVLIMSEFFSNIVSNYEKKKVKNCGYYNLVSEHIKVLFVDLVYSLHNILYLPILVIRLRVDGQGIRK